MFERGSLTLFHVGGIPIRAHWTLLLVLPYIAFVFSSQFSAVAALSGTPTAAVRLPPLVWGALIALGLFASIAIHELAHSLVAVRSGGRVRDITLMLLGGVSHLEAVPRRPATEALVSVVGPVASLAIGGALLGAQHVAGAGDARLGLFYLAYLNLVLGVFNLLPAFPMDGGRVLRAALSAWIGARRATDIAAGVGSVSAALLALWGLTAGNWLLVLVGLFIFSGAQAEARNERVREALSGLRVSDLLMAPVATVPCDAPVGDILPAMHRAGRLELVVVDRNGSPVGVVRATDLADQAGRLAPGAVVADLGPRIGRRAIAIPWHASADTALDVIGGARAEYLLVVAPEASGRQLPVGLVGMRELESAIALHTLRQRRPRRGSAPPVPGSPQPTGA